MSEDEDGWKCPMCNGTDYECHSGMPGEDLVVCKACNYVEVFFDINVVI